MDGRYRIFCSLFVKDKSKYGILVNILFKKWVNVHKIVDSHPSNLYHLNAMADSSTFVQSVDYPQHNVDICINSALVKTIEENRQIRCSAECILFVDGNDWHLGEMVDLDIMVTRKFLGINEGFQLAKHNSIINAHLERLKLKNITYASPYVQNKIINEVRS